MLAHLVVKLVAGHAVFLGINKDGEVAVVVAHAGEVVPELDAFDVAEGLAVTDGYLMAGLNGDVYLAEVEKAVGGAYLVHLAVDAGGDDAGLSGETEVLEVVDALLSLLIVHHHGSTLHGVVHLGGVETERGNVASVKHTLALAFHTEGVGGIVDDFEAVFVGYVLDGLRVAGFAVDMYGHDGGCFGGDGGFYLGRVDAARLPFDVYKNGLNAVPPQSVGGGDERVGGGDDFAGDAQGLEGGDKGQSAVGEKAYIGHFEVFCQSGLQLTVEGAVVGYPLAVPYLAEHRVKLVEVGKQWGCDGNGLCGHNMLKSLSPVPLPGREGSVKT